MYEEFYNNQSNGDAVGLEHHLPDELRKRLPNLSLALCGRRGSKASKTRPIPPATLILFCRDDGIGFVIAPKDGDQNAHGFIEAPADLFEQIETAIDRKRVGWKPASKKRS